MSTFKPFLKVDLSVLIQEVEFDFLFENTDVELYYKKVMACTCGECGFTATTMSALNRHTTAEHNKSFCDLCLRNARVCLL